MLDIVIPVYNEALNIENCLNELSLKVYVPFKALIVYDFPEDNTLPVVENIKDNYKFSINLIKNTIGKGPLNAIKAGLNASDGDAVLVSMADLSDDIKIVDTMYSLIKGGADIVCGSRYMKGGRQAGGSFIKKTMSRMAGLSLYYLASVPTHDATNSFKMYSRKVIDNINIESDKGFVLGLELTVKAFLKGYKIKEIPSVWTDRVEGESRFKIMAWLPSYLKWYFVALIYGIPKRFINFIKIQK
ncbi:MAG: glycosyltransferase family 2 protein [bacterium]